MKVKHEHVVPAPVDKVMDAYADPTFYCEKLKNSGALSVEVLEREELAGGKVRMKARATEKSRIPPIPMVKKPDVDTYVDDSVFDRTARVLTWKVTPSMFADKFFLSGKMEFFPQGDQTRLVFHTELEVKIFGVGGAVEKVGLAKTEEEVKRQVEFTKKWVATH
jgi:hypothetical protein